MMGPINAEKLDKKNEMNTNNKPGRSKYFF
jgi:hypothetical protein